MTIWHCEDIRWCACFSVCLQTVLSTYLLGEPTKELIQELREDEAYILERFKGREKRTNGESEGLWQVEKRFEESKNATIYTLLFLQRLCAISSQSGLQRTGLPKGKKMNQLAGRSLLWKPPTLIIVAMNPGENVAPGIHESGNLSE